jgi:hypothetical protein
VPIDPSDALVAQICHRLERLRERVAPGASPTVQAAFATGMARLWREAWAEHASVRPPPGADEQAFWTRVHTGMRGAMAEFAGRHLPVLDAAALDQLQSLPYTQH